MSLARRLRPTSSLALLAAVVILSAAVAVVGQWASPAAAHTALIDTSPALDETAGGTIEFIDLAFFEPVSNAVLTVSYNEQALAGETTVSDGEILRFKLGEALTLPGRYEVSYDLISFDGDHTTSSFFFTFDPDGPQPTRLGLQDAENSAGGESGGIDPGRIVITAVLLLALFGALGLFVWRMDAKRRRETPL